MDEEEEEEVGDTEEEEEEEEEEVAVLPAVRDADKDTYAIRSLTASNLSSHFLAANPPPNPPPSVPPIATATRTTNTQNKVIGTPHIVPLRVLLSSFRF